MPDRSFEKALKLVNIQRDRMSVQAVQVLNDLASVHTGKRDYDSAMQCIK